MDMVTTLVEWVRWPAGENAWAMFLLDVSLKGSLIVLVAAIATFGLRRGSAALRHHVWGVALGSLIALPLLGLVLPRWHVPVLPEWPAVQGAAAVPITPMDTRALVPLPTLRELPPARLPERVAVLSPLPSPAGPNSAVLPTVLPTPSLPLPPSIPAEAGDPVVRWESSVPRQASPTAAVPATVFAFPATESWSVAALGWPVLVLLGWALGAVAIVAVLGCGLLRVWMLSRGAAPVTDPELQLMVRQLSAQLDLARPVRLLQSDMSVTPMTWGYQHPTVLVPRHARSWSANRRRAVLLHELAHVKRNDYITQLFARYACAIYWFNPLVWWASRCLRVERERACDDAVIVSGAKPSEYATHLLDIARSLKASTSTAFATVAMARPSQLTGRLLAILDDRQNRGSVGRIGAVASWMVAGALVLPVAMATGRLAQAAEPPSERGSSPVLAAAAAPSTPAVRPSGPALADVPSPSTPVVVPSLADPAATAGSARSLDPRPAAIDDPILAPVRAAPVPTQTVTWASASRCVEAQDADNRGTQSNTNNDRHTIRWWDEDCEGEVRIRGDVDFTGDFTDVARLGRGARFSIEIDDANIRRRVEMGGSPGGDVTRRWFVDGREAEYGADAQRWLPLALVDFFRHSSYKLDERVEWILATRGVAGLLDEANFGHSQYMRARFYGKAIESGQLPVADVNRLVGLVSTTIDSDFELARLLRSMPARYLQDENVRQTYVNASNSLDSDFEKARVLRTMLEQPGLTNQTVMLLLRSARDLDSDFELARLLIEVGPQYLGNDALRRAYLDAADSIESDFELRRVLAALLAQPNLTGEQLLLLLNAARGIESDFELGRLLRETANRYLIDETLRQPFFRAVNSIDSDHEHRQVLSALLQRSDVTTAILADVLASAMTIDSDFELSSILRAAAQRYTGDDTLRPAFFRAIGTLDSDFERRRVLSEISARENLSTALVLDVIAAAAAMDSDHEKANILIPLARRYVNDADIRSAILNVADSIDSDYEHSRIVRAARGRERNERQDQR